MHIPPLVPVTTPEITLRRVDARFAYELDNRAAIDRAFEEARQTRPKLFNGRFFLLVALERSAAGVVGDMVETDYASYLSYRAAGFPGEARNCFPMPALHPVDGGLLVGRMAGWTANAGRWYPPAGSLDENDLLPDGRFDMDGNIARELHEELGLDARRFPAPASWTLVAEPGRLACLRRHDLDMTGAELLAACRRHLAQDPQPELDDVAIVRSLGDLEDRDAPDFVRAYVAAALGA